MEERQLDREDEERAQQMRSIFTGKGPAYIWNDEVEGATGARNV